MSIPTGLKSDRRLSVSSPDHVDLWLAGKRLLTWLRRDLCVSDLHDPILNICAKSDDRDTPEGGFPASTKFAHETPPVHLLYLFVLFASERSLFFGRSRRKFHGLPELCEKTARALEGVGRVSLFPS